MARHATHKKANTKATPSATPPNGGARGEGKVKRAPWAGFAALAVDGSLHNGLQREVPDDTALLCAREDKEQRKRERQQKREAAAYVLQRNVRIAAHRSWCGRVGGLLARAWPLRPYAQRRAVATIEAAVRRWLERRARKARSAELVAYARLRLLCGLTQEVCVAGVSMRLACGPELAAGQQNLNTLRSKRWYTTHGNSHVMIWAMSFPRRINKIRAAAVASVAVLCLGAIQAVPTDP